MMLIFLILFFLTFESVSGYTIKKNDLINYYDTLSLEDKVSQLFIVYTNNFKFSQNHPGGVIPSKTLLKNIYHKKIVPENFLMEFPIPPFVCIDQEGGKVDRLSFIEKTPSLNSIFHNYEKRYEILKIMVLNEKRFGINLNLSPVLDLSYEKNSMIRRTDRNILSTDDSIKEFIDTYISLHKSKKILNCIKHFPGYGETFDNSDVVIPKFRGDKKLFEKNLDLFYYFFDKVSFVMVSNIIYPFLDTVPATRSKNVVKLVRDRREDIVIIADDIASRSNKNPFFVLKESFKSGVDMFILMNDTLFEYMVDSLTLWISKGEIEEKELDQKLFRIFVKKEYLFNMIKNKS
uniref:beta-N-acetylhexosaminidase n=1 Tax=candidate division WOR-3 bacterium TaxID=2052148 RepID=A0A7C3J5L8_UNCW3